MCQVPWATGLTDVMHGNFVQGFKVNERIVEYEMFGYSREGLC